MSFLKMFLLKYDKSISAALFLIIIAIIPIIMFMPSTIESYTYNSYINGLRDNYIECSNVFKFISIFSIILLVISIIYSLLRKFFLDTNESFTIYVWILVVTLLVPFISLYFINAHYEYKNNNFITAKIIDVKNSITSGQCSLTKTKDVSISYGKVSDCGTVKEKMPGDLWFLSAGKFTKRVKKDDVHTVVTMDKPNTITYNNYLPSFCRTLADKDNSLYKEFTVIEVHGINALSPEFKFSSCEEHKNQGQIQFMFK